MMYGDRHWHESDYPSRTRGKVHRTPFVENQLSRAAGDSCGQRISGMGEETLLRHARAGILQQPARAAWELFLSGVDPGRYRLCYESCGLRAHGKDSRRTAAEGIGIRRLRNGT